MRIQMIDVKHSLGRVLCSTIFRAGGQKLMSKGHVISGEDARILETAGLVEVWVHRTGRRRDRRRRGGNGSGH
jgi:hypothetical protein